MKGRSCSWKEKNVEQLKYLHKKEIAIGRQAIDVKRTLNVSLSAVFAA